MKNLVNWAFLSTVKYSKIEQNHKVRAKWVISSVITKNTRSKSSTQYECHANSLMSGAALKGDIVK